jgi:hypothetical protein
VNTKTSTQQAKNLFRPLLGQLAWRVRGGYGSFLTLEFGAPHLAVREPITPKHARSKNVKRVLRRRHVSILGDWHLWIQYCDWKITVAGGSLDSETIGTSSPEDCLFDLDGQRLISVESGTLPNSWQFQFDLGGALELWPSATYEPHDHLWSLHPWDGDIASLQADGTLTFEKAKTRG